MKSLVHVLFLGMLVASLAGCGMKQYSKNMELTNGGHLQAVATVQRDPLGTQVTVIDRFLTMPDGTPCPLSPASGASAGWVPGIATGAGMVGAALLWPTNNVGGASAAATSGPATSNASAVTGP